MGPWPHSFLCPIVFRLSTFIFAVIAFSFITTNNTVNRSLREVTPRGSEPRPPTWQVILSITAPRQLASNSPNFLIIYRVTLALLKANRKQAKRRAI